MWLLSGNEMQACDRVTSEVFGVPSIELMRNASRAVAGFVRQQFPQAQRVMVLCGRGNNGGDGMMTARLLAEVGVDVTTILLGSPDSLKGDAAVAWKELNDSPLGHIRIVDTGEDLADHSVWLEADLIVDAVLGTGFTPPMRGLALDAREWLRGSSAPILAIDLPSGWPADATSATVDGPVFPADAVITFTAPKPAHVFGQLTRRWNQAVVVAEIGSPKEAVLSALNIEWAGAAHALTEAPREADANKGKFGHVLVAGGSAGKSGAPAMASLAALRVGAGLVTAAVPAPVLSLVAGVAPELMTHSLLATEAGQIAAINLREDQMAEFMKGITVLAVGPGIGQSAETAEFVMGLLARTKIPAVVDADALNIVAQRPEMLPRLAEGRFMALTPHPGEMARLAGITTAAVQANRLEIAREFARRNGVTLVLKGARTLIAHPSGRVAVNTTGNPGMAKGGSGDLLTGMIAGVLAQFPHDEERAVEAAVYLHGLAADVAVERGDEHTLLATDCIREFSRAFRFRSRGANGYVWLQGGIACSSPLRG
jgi:ADP-dependent NAD(P)H-hydrate dehydratase / NAD(P)H-hydrate epimerase